MVRDNPRIHGAASEPGNGSPVFGSIGSSSYRAGVALQNAGMDESYQVLKIRTVFSWIQHTPRVHLGYGSWVWPS